MPIFNEPAPQSETPAAQSTIPILTPANDPPSDDHNPDPTGTPAHPIPFPKVM